MSVELRSVAWSAQAECHNTDSGVLRVYFIFVGEGSLRPPGGRPGSAVEEGSQLHHSPKGLLIWCGGVRIEWETANFPQFRGSLRRAETTSALFCH